MLCDSIKVKDPMKVGRFGLGFKSVFHVTGKFLFELNLINIFMTASIFELIVAEILFPKLQTCSLTE